MAQGHLSRWAEAPVKIARMTLTIKLDGNWSSFQLANNTPPLSVTGSVIAPSARIPSCHDRARATFLRIAMNMFESKVRRHATRGMHDYRHLQCL